jgi:hypothetical protein
VRLYVANVAPEGRWETRRELALALGVPGHAPVPHGVVHIDGERHAIQVWLNPWGKAVMKSLIEKRLGQYDAVVCFCTPLSRRFLLRLARENDWQNVGILDLPKGA